MPTQNNYIVSTRSNAYLQLALGSIPRLFSLLDRNPFSPTYGCLDRAYWHYKTLTDFPSATYQQAALTLTLLCLEDFEGNIYFKNQKVREYALAALLYWSKIQRRDGSFDEWYPNEHSHVATAFTTYAISQAYRLLNSSGEMPAGLLLSLKKAGQWLTYHTDTDVLNHTAGAVAALHNLYLITGEKAFHKGLQRQKEIIFSRQSKEGWFYEYGGADPGYLSLSVDYLAKYFSSSGDEEVLKPLEKALDFMTRFVHPDGSYGGEYGSRNTRYLMPHGLVVLSPLFPQARYLAQVLYKTLERGKTVGPHTCDDRYFTFFFLNNYLEAGLNYTPQTATPFLAEEFEEHFPEAGILVKKNKNYYLVCNYKKNGVTKLFSLGGEEPQPVFNDCGYFAELAGGQIATSQFLSSGSPPDSTVTRKEGRIVITLKAPFAYANYSLPFKKVMVPFRIFNYTAGVSDKVMGIFNHWVKGNFITKNIQAPVLLWREIVLEESRVTIHDRVTKKTTIPCRRISIEGGNSTTTHVPSSRYFLLEDLRDSAFPCLEAAEKLNQAGGFDFFMEVVFKGTHVHKSVKLADINPQVEML